MTDDNLIPGFLDVWKPVLSIVWRLMVHSGALFIGRWMLSAAEHQLVWGSLPLFDGTLNCSLHDLVPLINLSQTPPGFGDLPNLQQICNTPRGP